MLGATFLTMDLQILPELLKLPAMRESLGLKNFISSQFIRLKDDSEFWKIDNHDVRLAGELKLRELLIVLIIFSDFVAHKSNPCDSSW